jgi:hypothetical protein
VQSEDDIKTGDRRQETGVRRDESLRSIDLNVGIRKLASGKAAYIKSHSDFILTPDS